MSPVDNLEHRIEQLHATTSVEIVPEHTDPGCGHCRRILQHPGRGSEHLRL
jgi:hypothetical protein